MDTMNAPSPVDAVLAVLPKSVDECWEVVTLWDWLQSVCPVLRLSLEDVEGVVREMESRGLVECSEEVEDGALTVGMTDAGIAAAAALPPEVLDAVQPPVYPLVYPGVVNWRMTAALNRITNAKPEDVPFAAGMALGLADGLRAAGGLGETEWVAVNRHVQHLYRNRQPKNSEISA